MKARKKPSASRPPLRCDPETRCGRRTPSEVSLPDAKGRVLIVEDDVPLSTVVEDALTDEGYAVVGTARSAEEAISMAVDHAPDLVLMDVKLLHNSDGIAAAGQILERTGIRCLMATGQIDAKTRERAAVVQPLGWLPKPYRNEEMVQAVADAMRCNRAS